MASMKHSQHLNFFFFFITLCFKYEQTDALGSQSIKNKLDVKHMCLGICMLWALKRNIGGGSILNCLNQ